MFNLEKSRKDVNELSSSLLLSKYPVEQMLLLRLTILHVSVLHLRAQAITYCSFVHIVNIRTIFKINSEIKNKQTLLVSSDNCLSHDVTPALCYSAPHQDNSLWVSLRNPYDINYHRTFIARSVISHKGSNGC